MCLFINQLIQAEFWSLVVHHTLVCIMAQLDNVGHFIISKRTNHGGEAKCKLIVEVGVTKGRERSVCRLLGEREEWEPIIDQEREKRGW